MQTTTSSSSATITFISYPAKDLFIKSRSQGFNIIAETPGSVTTDSLVMLEMMIDRIKGVYCVKYSDAGK